MHKISKITLVAPLFLTILLLLIKISFTEESQLLAEPHQATKSDQIDIEASISPILRISGAKTDSPGEQLPPAKTTPLSKEATEGLFSRLKDFEKQAEATQFLRRDLPPPGAAAAVRVRGDFPALEDLLPPGIDTVTSGESLRIVRAAPEGAVSIAPHVVVSFSQPMVGLSGQSELAKEIPATLTPEPPGSWRWLGTNTLLFEPETGRLPMATDFTISVTEAKSVLGNRLNEPWSTEFSTPAPELTGHFPFLAGPGQPLDTPIILKFNQRVSQIATLEHLQIIAGDRAVPFILLDPEQLEPEFIDHYNNFAQNTEREQLIVIKPKQPLPAKTRVSVKLKEGLPSLEGTRLSERAYNFSFGTHGPLAVSLKDISWVYSAYIASKDGIKTGADKRFAPEDEWTFTFNNLLSADDFDPTLVSISPETPDLTIAAEQGAITVKGKKRPNTEFNVKISKDLKDIFGQTLGEDHTFTIKTGHDMPSFSMFERPIKHLILDPAGDAQLMAQTINYSEIELQVFRVTADDWDAFKALVDSGRRQPLERFTEPIPGEEIYHGKVPIKGQPDEHTITKISLSPYLKENRGHLIVRVNPGEVITGARTPRHSVERLFWVQGTDIGLDVWSDRKNLIVLASSLKTGKPLERVSVTVGSRTLFTGSDGLVRFPSPQKSTVVHAKTQGDSALLGVWSWGQNSRHSAVFHVASDREIYRPGEEVFVKGWIRRLTPTIGNDIELFDKASAVSYTVVDARGVDIVAGSTPLSKLGSFDFSLRLPETPNLGLAQVKLNFAEQHYSYLFSIQEFRTPEFEVKTQIPEGPYFSGDTIKASTVANYYAGGSLPDAEVNWHFSLKEAHFVPPNQHRYSFGRTTPWFWRWCGSGRTATVADFAFQDRTDLAGSNTTEAAFEVGKVPVAMTFESLASVTDLNRQRWGSRASTLIHPGSYYVGLKTDSYFAQPGQPYGVNAIVSDIEGNLVSGIEIEVVAERLLFEWGVRNNNPAVLEAHRCNLSSASDAVRCSFVPEQGGSWRITATIHDKQGRPAFTTIRRWVSGFSSPPQGRVTQQELIIIPDKDEYQAGDTAKILVQSPFAPAVGLVTLERLGIVEQRNITFQETTQTIEVPMREGYVPNLHLRVNLVGVTARAESAGSSTAGLAKQPALAGGSINLRVPPHTRTLQLEATPRKASLAPGEETEIDITVRDSNNRPVANAEVTVVVVDEAVLALAQQQRQVNVFQMAEILKAFYRDRPSLVQTAHNRSNVFLEQLGAKLSTASLNRDGIREAGANLANPDLRMAFANDLDSTRSFAAHSVHSTSSMQSIRSDFNPVAAFFPAEHTSRNGNLAVTVKLPGNLTRYRVLVVATSGAKHFGTTESTLTGRLGLMVRPSAPRFLNFGDSFELPVILQNHTESALDVQIATRAQNLELKEQGYQLEIPAGNRVEVRFPAQTIKAGMAELQFIAAAGDFTDAASVTIPVWTPATSEAFATYGTIGGGVDKSGVLHRVKRPAEVWQQFGGLEISTSSSAFKQLNDAFNFLFTYPFRSAEVIASRLISVVALKDVIDAFQEADIPNAAELDKLIKTEINDLVALQLSSGGFKLWTHGGEILPFVSVHAIHALIRVHQEGYILPQRALESARTHIREIKKHIPKDYSETSRRTIEAYALYVRAVDGDYDRTRLESLLREQPLDEWGVAALGWFLYALGETPQSPLVDEILRSLTNRVHETAATAEFAENISESDKHLIFQSARRSDAIALEALMRVRPQSDLISKLVQGLLSNRRQGRWLSTQENSFVLLALNRYFKKYESQTPDFTARAWLGEQYAGSFHFEGRTTLTHNTEIPMQQLASDDDTQNLILQKEGAGLLYYRLGLQYAPLSLELEKAEHGFLVERRYESGGEPEDVRRDSAGVWRISAGAQLKVTVRMVAAGQRYHVALVDPIPAGFEILNPAISNWEPFFKPSPHQTLGLPRWQPRWFEYQNLRTERAEAFRTVLPGGVYEYSYNVRATTPGNFIVPPAKAHEMYAPETFGRSGSARVVIE